MTNWFAQQWRRLGFWLRRDEMERELADEMALHREMKAARMARDGEPTPDPRRAFGNATAFAEDSRSYWGWNWLDSLTRDVRQAVRSLARDKAYSTTVALTLTVCVAANTATFAVVHSVLLRPLPVPNAERMVLFANRYPKAGGGTTTPWRSSVGDYYDRQQAISAIEQSALFQQTTHTLDLSGRVEQIESLSVTPTFFPLIGATPAEGRFFAPEEGEIGHESKVVIGDPIRRRLFGDDPSVVGRTLRLNRRPFVIVGVLKPGFTFAFPETQIWVPLAFPPQLRNLHHNNSWYHVALLKRGATIRQAQEQVNALNAANLERFPQFKEALINAGFVTVVEPLQRMVVGDVSNKLYLLWGGAILVLLIGVLNIGNLILARSSARRKEIATRLAIGAGSIQVARQITVENLVVSAVGSAAGVLGGIGLLAAGAGWGLDRLPRSGEVRVDATVAAISVGGAIVLCLIAGLLALAQDLGVNLATALHDTSRAGTSGVRTRFVRRAIVAAEIGIAFALLLSTGALYTTFHNLLNLDPGFKADNVWTVSANAPRARFREEKEIAALVDRIAQSVREIPGVDAAGITSIIPLGGHYNDSVIVAEGYQMQPGESLVDPYSIAVTPGYFEAMGIALRRGRYFNAGDSASAPPVIIVDEKLANKFWPGRDPVGQRMYQPDASMKAGPETTWLRVVGVVASVRVEDLAATGGSGAYYFPFAQEPNRTFTIAARSAARAASVASAIAARVATVDRELALFDAKPMTERRIGSLSSRSTALSLTVAFGAVALFLAAVGVYGVLSYLVAQRRREIGIRIALGSTQSAVWRLIMGESLRLSILGVAVGLALAFAIKRVIEREVYGVKPLDPMMLAAVAFILVGVGAVACSAPARRAARTDPARVLVEG